MRLHMKVCKCIAIQSLVMYNYYDFESCIEEKEVVINE